MSLMRQSNTYSEPEDVCLKGKALVLDFGSVISRSIFEKRFEVADKLGLPRDNFGWAGPTSPDSDELWRDMLDDKLTEREYWAAMAKDIGSRLGQDWTPLDYLNAARADNINNDIRPEIVELVRRAKASGAKIGILSNELELFYGKEAMDSIEILDEIDVMVDATHTKILKPDPRAYEEVLALLNIPAVKSVFLDDQPRNVKGGLDFGMASIYFDVRAPQAICDKAWDALVKA